MGRKTHAPRPLKIQKEAVPCGAKGRALKELQDKCNAVEPSATLEVPAQHRPGTEPLSRIIGDLDYCLTQVDPIHPLGAALVRIGVALRNLNKRNPEPPAAEPSAVPCKGKNCGTTDYRLHSAECFAEHDESSGACTVEQLRDLLKRIVDQTGIPNGLFAEYRAAIDGAPEPPAAEPTAARKPDKFELAFEIMRQLEAEDMETMQSCQFGYVMRVTRERRSEPLTKTACKHDSPQDCEKWHDDPKNCCTTDETNERRTFQRHPRARFRCKSCGHHWKEHTHSNEGSWCPESESAQ